MGHKIRLTAASAMKGIKLETREERGAISFKKNYADVVIAAVKDLPRFPTAILAFQKTKTMCFQTDFQMQITFPASCLMQRSVIIPCFPALPRIVLVVGCLPSISKMNWLGQVAQEW